MGRPRNMPHNVSSGISCCKWDEEVEGPMKWFDYSGSYKFSEQMEAPNMVSTDAPSTSGGSGVGAGTTTVVVQQNTSTAPVGMIGNDAVSLERGVDGVASNVFAKEAICKVDVEPTLRRDLCCDTTCCCFGQYWFFKLPDCLGTGCDATCLFGKVACTGKLLQKPTFCEELCFMSCFDMSTCCSNKGENDDTCCSAYTCACQETCLCLCQHACKTEIALMRTCVKCWLWLLIFDTRCAFPCSSFQPMGCTLCGFGWRAGSGVGCQIRADNDPEGTGGAQTTSTTVVVQSG